MHHLAVMVSNMLLPEPAAVNFGVRNETLVEEVVLFALRGLGLSEAAMDRHLDARALNAFVRSLAEPASRFTTSGQSVVRVLEKREIAT